VARATLALTSAADTVTNPSSSVTVKGGTVVWSMTIRLLASEKDFPGTAVTLMIRSVTTLTFSIDVSAGEAGFSLSNTPSSVCFHSFRPHETIKRKRTGTTSNFLIRISLI